MFPTWLQMLRCMLGVTINSLITIVVSSNPFVTVSRIIDKNGFHRNLRTEIYIPSESMHFKTSTGDIACKVLLEETLPSGAFVDLYQLQSLRAFGGPDVLCLHDIDTEQPEFLSQPLTIFIFSHLHLYEGHWISNVTLPIHMRYQKPLQRQDYVTVKFSNPALFMRCPDAADTDAYDKIEMEFPCESINQSVCTWSRVDYTSGNLEVQVPVGRLEHLPFVIGATIFITLVGCLMLIYSVIHHVPSMIKSKDS